MNILIKTYLTENEDYQKLSEFLEALGNLLYEYEYAPMESDGMVHSLIVVKSTDIENYESQDEWLKDQLEDSLMIIVPLDERNEDGE